MSDRETRRRLIRRLIKNHHVASQDELLTLLGAEGVRCNQATLSRDLRDLGVIRQRTKAGTRYRLDATQQYRDAVRKVIGMEILDVRHNGALVVVRTLSGRAEGVAGFLDAWENPLILGTVAGDDTVFVAPRRHEECQSMVEAIEGLSVPEEEPAA